MLRTFQQPQYPSPSIPSHHPFQVPHHTDPLLQSSHQSSKLPRQRQKQRILQVKRVVGLRHLPLEIISTANGFRNALNIRGAVTSWNPNNFSYKFLTVQFETGKPKNFEKLEFNPIFFHHIFQQPTSTWKSLGSTFTHILFQPKQVYFGDPKNYAGTISIIVIASVHTETEAFRLVATCQRCCR